MADTTQSGFKAEGGCACGDVRYRMNREPLIVHCCHCRWCQRETGTSFALNAVLESKELQLLEGQPERIETPSESGKGQAIIRCPHCRVALWSHYAGAGDKSSMVRVGTLDEPDLLPPDIHIFTESKQAWVDIPEGVPSFEQYYDPRELWPAKSQERFLAMKKADS